MVHYLWEILWDKKTVLPFVVIRFLLTNISSICITSLSWKSFELLIHKACFASGPAAFYVPSSEWMFLADSCGFSSHLGEAHWHIPVCFSSTTEILDCGIVVVSGCCSRKAIITIRSSDGSSYFHWFLARTFFFVVIFCWNMVSSLYCTVSVFFHFCRGSNYSSIPVSFPFPWTSRKSSIVLWPSPAVSLSVSINIFSIPLPVGFESSLPCG